MSDLMALWRSRVEAIVGIVRAGQTEHREVANMAAQVSEDYHGRFIVELLQNASDQATAAGLRDSCVTIIRTSELLAFTNEGVPFNDAGLRSITSMGLSTKNPQDAIGNKGIGFKSVFQVSESPEIYSSRAVADSFADSLGLTFKLSLTPFAAGQFKDVIHRMVVDELATRVPTDASLTVDHVLSEVEAAPPFKFPLPLSAEDLEARLVELAERPGGQTLVVLPLRQTPGITTTVEHAINELFGEDGAAILFLPSVSTVKVIDRVRGFTRTISRRLNDTSNDIAGFGRVSTVITDVQESDKLCERSWRLIERCMGTADFVSDDQAAHEAQSINVEARKLPGTNWNTVQSSPIGVAIPLPKPVAENSSLLLGARGRVCIGLPTKDPTGTPTWVNAHFHGTISRTGIDLKENTYNALLFDEAVRLHGALIADLQADADLQIRRTATLAFERGDGPLAHILYISQSQMQRRVILSIDTQTYQTPAQTVLPDPADVNALFLMVPQKADLARFGLKLPEVGITRNARPLIETLVGARTVAPTVATLLLDRSWKNLSVMEYAAQIRRSDGPGFWEKFLSWVVGRFKPEELAEQRLLPVGKDALAKPSERVFLPPSPRRSAESAADHDGEILEIPADLAQSLRFLDDSAVVVRKADMHSLTDLANKLAPDVGRGLVRRPRLVDLINDAVGPLMQQLEKDEESRQNGIRFLKQAVQWLWELSESGAASLTKDVLRVPVMTAEEVWEWVPPSTAYFGCGWLGPPIDLLLHEAYGHEPKRLLLSWRHFSENFGIQGDEQNAWIGAMELMGVSRSPKLIRPRPVPRGAPLVSRDYSELSIDSSTCPISKAEPFWRPYLEATRKRKAKTATGQTFDFRSTTWIDGLEREPSRSAVIKLMLLNPTIYEAEARTFLERKRCQNDDATDVPSLWVHTINANEWKVIPTEGGAVAVVDAWLLDGQQRGLARGRLTLLNQVEAPYDSAYSLLERIGVTTLQMASVPRLLHAISQLGATCARYDAETRRTALTLTQDLFSHLQSAYFKQPGPLPDLKAFCFPIERNGEAIGVRGDQIATGYFNDDPVRAGFIAGFSEANVWPLDIRRAYRHLVAELQRQLGEIAVVFTSRAAVETRFTEDDTRQRAPLLDWLSAAFPQYSVASDLACLIAYMGRAETDPTGEHFKRTWRTFQRAWLAFGTFPTDTPTPYFYDRTTSVLQVASSLSDSETVEATWMLVGPSYCDTWSMYSRALDRNKQAKFLSDRQVTLVRRENVENAIELSSSERFKNVRAVALALWWVRFGEQPVSLFEAEWVVNARSVRRLCDWLGRPDLGDFFAKCLGISEEIASLEIIRAGEISSDQWQQARLSLGMDRWPFTHKIKAWQNTMTELVSILKTCVARSVAAEPTDLQPILRDVMLDTPTDAAAYDANAENDVLPSVLNRMKSVLGGYCGISGVDFMRRRLDAIVVQTTTTLATVKLDDAPARDIRVYRDDDEGKRSRDAQARLDGLMIVASALARNLGEQLAENDVRFAPNVALLRSGWWANSFTIMAAIQRVLQATVPKAAQRMSDERVFHSPAPANELLARFKELAGTHPLGPAIVPPKRNITILGRSQTEDDASTDLLQGTAGVIGKQLHELAKRQPFDSGLGKCDRAKVDLAGGKTKTRGNGRGGGGGPSESKRDREIAGLLGEAFVYEHFRLALSGFDEMAWLSANRNAYGLEGDGSDSLGYDFLYRDIENTLAGRTDRPRCEIEVKASSGDGREPFQMSANEWDRARECHRSSDSVYIILRVAHVRDAPEIIDAIIDPFGLYGAGLVGIVTQDIWVHVGAPPTTNAEAREGEPGAVSAAL